MALEFYLRLNTSHKPREFVDYLVKTNGFVKNEDSDGGDFYGRGFVAWIYEVNENIKNLIFESVGIHTNLNIRCWHDNDYYEEGMRNILNLYMNVLKYTKGDALIQLELDDIKLLRKNGKIFVNPQSFFNEEDALWRFKDIPFSEYEVKELEFAA